MSGERAAPVSLRAPQPQVDRPSSRVPCKRKLGVRRPLLEIAESGYPSPPMSVPPSPPPTHSESHRTTTSELATIAQPVADPTASIPSVTTSTPTGTSQGGLSPTLASAQLANVSSASGPSLPLVPSDRPNHAPPAFAAYSTFPTRSSRRNVRRSNTHVASACVNCKRAHLSCDVQRPCARCVASGKQDTCYDVQHKKRGRPRLRDESGVQIADQAIPAQVVQPVSPNTAVASSSRPIATPRPRRASSLRSSASEGYQSELLGIPPLSTLQPSQTHPRGPSADFPPADVPTALLDLDLVVLRANRSFERTMANDRNLIGSSLIDMVSPADRSSLESIQTRLRTERDAREQSSLPPIYPSIHDRFDNISEADIDRLASGFEDNTYTWARRSPGGPSAETFPARVRLAKSSTYFVVVTLPTFRPMMPHSQQSYPRSIQPYPPLQQTQTPTLPDPSLHARRSTSQPPPPSFNPAYPTASPWSMMRQPPPLLHSDTPRLPPLEPAPDMEPFRYQTSQAEMLPRTDRAGVQLPPIGTTSPFPDRATGLSPELSGGSAQRRSASDDEESQRAPKKRKIMGIDNVLQ